MSKQFTDVCETARSAEALFNRTMEVYNYLKTLSAPITPADLALALNWKYGDGTGVAARVTKPLYWLYRMGLIDRESYKREIKLDAYGGGHWEKDVQVINGKEYTHEEWVEDGSSYYVKVVTSYRWFIKK